MHVSLDEGLDALEIYFGSRGNRSGKLKNIDVKPVGKLDQFLHERVLNTRCSAALSRAIACSPCSQAITLPRDDVNRAPCISVAIVLLRHARTMTAYKQ